MTVRASILATAIAAAIPLAATAQPVAGLYLGGALGIDIPQPQRINDSGLVDEELKINWGIGPAGILALGYGFGNGLRVELEGSYRRTGIDAIVGTDVLNVSGGSQHNYGLMVNGVFDVNLGSDVVYPYLGVGMGYLWTGLDDYSLGPRDGRAPGMRASGTDGSAAYQVMLGAAFPIAAVPGLSLTAEYRFLGTFDHQSYDGYRVNPKGVRTDASLSLGTQRHSTILIGARFAFGGPSPAR